MQADQELLPLKLSLAVLSSNFLEANNKVAKAVMRRLLGGGVRQPGGEHLPLVQRFKWCHGVSCVVWHTQTYPTFAKELIDIEEESGHLQGVASTSDP
jgi:hypothetical protein